MILTCSENKLMKIEDFCLSGRYMQGQPSQLNDSLSSAQQQTNEFKRRFSAIFMI